MGESPLDTIMSVENVRFQYSSGGSFRKSRVIRAVDNVSFGVQRGETFGVVGESGCGKSTLGKLVVGLYRPIEGRIMFNGNPLFELDKEQAKRLRQKLGMIFQDPFSSLDPRMTIFDIVMEPKVIHKLDGGVEKKAQATSLLELVGLNPEHLYRYPHEFSGGQRQRIAIARALASAPDLLVLDEPTSALDVSVQAQILNLLKKLQVELGLTYMFISHDLNVIRHLSNRVAVMYMGKIVEIGDLDTVFKSPQHPYTKCLLSAIPDPYSKQERIVLKGEVPSLADPPPGCRFHTRCPYAMPICKEMEPRLIDADRSSVACHLVNYGNVPSAKP